MTTQIVIHLLPQEIDWFEGQIKQLKQGSYYLEDDDNVIIDVTLNLNLVEWEKSKLPKQFFIEKFNQLEKLCDWCKTQFIIDEENKCLGCDDKRREAIRTTTSDNILYLDSDLIFKPELLKYMMDSAKVIPNEYYLISPQIIKLWDDSWDCLVHQDYLDLQPSQEYKNVDPYLVISNQSQEISIKPINRFKFGGGWFNLLSTKLLKLTDMPDSFGPYGVDDTYVMLCCGIMKQKEYDIQQYVLEGMIVAENIKYRWNPYSDLLYSINRQDEFRKQAESNLGPEVELFINKTKPNMNKIGISLGWNCSPAGYGVENGLRGSKANGYQTCPFDEMVSNLPGIIECIKDDFKYFMDDNYLKIKEVPFNVGGTVKGEKLIYNTKYNFYFNHESPGHGGLYISQGWTGGINHYIDNNYELLKKRYNRRIESFRNYIKEGQEGSEIIFIVFRYNKDVKELKQTLDETYPNMKYRIVVENPPETIESVYMHHVLMGIKEENITKEIQS